MTAKITPNYAGMSELLRSEEMRVMCVDRAEPVKSLAEEIAPVFEQGPHPGRYKASFLIESGTDNGAEKPRAYARVVNLAPEALSAEFGTANNDAHHTLLTALEAASGGRVKAVEALNTPRNEGPRLNKRTGKPVTRATIRRRRARKLAARGEA